MKVFKLTVELRILEILIGPEYRKNCVEKYSVREKIEEWSSKFVFWRMKTIKITSLIVIFPVGSLTFCDFYSHFSLNFLLIDVNKRISQGCANIGTYTS